MYETKPHPISLTEFQLHVLVIILQLVVVLSMFKSFPRVQQQLVPVYKLLVDCRQASFARHVGAQ
jgi:hypothetical protein